MNGITLTSKMKEIASVSSEVTRTYDDSIEESLIPQDNCVCINFILPFYLDRRAEKHDSHCAINM